MAAVAVKPTHKPRMGCGASSTAGLPRGERQRAEIIEQRKEMRLIAGVDGVVLACFVALLALAI